MAEVCVRVSRFHREDGRIFFQTFVTFRPVHNVGYERCSWQQTFMGYESGPPLALA